MHGADDHHSPATICPFASDDDDDTYDDDNSYRVRIMADDVLLLLFAYVSCLFNGECTIYFSFFWGVGGGWSLEVRKRAREWSLGRGFIPSPGDSLRKQEETIQPFKK